MTDTEAIIAATEFLSDVDPEGVSFWVITVNEYQGVQQVSLTTPPEGITTSSRSTLYRADKLAITSRAEPFKRFFLCCQAIHRLILEHSNPPENPSNIESIVLRDALPQLSSAVTTLTAASRELVIFNPIDFGYGWPKPEFGISFRFILNNAAVPVMLPLPPRSPRKWGRAWTPRWELEHAALVRQRKFSRNQQRIEKDNMKLRKRRTAKSRKRRAEKKRRDRIKLAAVPKACKLKIVYRTRRKTKRKK